MHTKAKGMIQFDSTRVENSVNSGLCKNQVLDKLKKCLTPPCHHQKDLDVNFIKLFYVFKSL